MNRAFFGTAACVVAIIGLKWHTFLLVPIAFVFTIIGLIRGLVRSNRAELVLAIISLPILIIGFLNSPTLMILATGIVGLWLINGALSSLPDLSQVFHGAEPRPAFVQASPPRPVPVRPSPMRQSADSIAPTPARPTQAITGFDRVVPIRFSSSIRAIGEERSGLPAAALWCRERRLRAELANYTQSTECFNQIMMTSFAQSGYRYMDLVATLTLIRRGTAYAIDHGTISEAVANAQFVRAYRKALQIELQRDVLK